MSLNRFILLVAMTSTTLACHRAPVIIEGGCPVSPLAASDQIRITHRRFPSADTGRAQFVVSLESSYPSLGQLSDAYVSLQRTTQPGAAWLLSLDSLHLGMYAARTVAPGVYAVLARRVGFRAIVDTVRLDAGWIDSATYHTVSNVRCLSSVARLSRISTMLPNER